MPIRTFRNEKQADPTDINTLPTDLPVAVYYRQSDPQQVGNISTAMQQVDLVEDMKRRGWAAENILLIDVDAGVSGTLRIDEREGMNSLYQLILSRAIGTVACQAEDRLFRDKTQIEVNKFIDACHKNRVYVVTPMTVYIFHHPTMGEFYKEMFRQNCKVGAAYLDFLTTRLGGARERLRREGKYAGGRVSYGYMVDVRKHSPTYRRFVRWDEYAEVVQKVFEVFVECGGRSQKTARTLRSRGIAFPDFRVVRPPEGFISPFGTKNSRRYLSATGIKLLVTNPVYIGHWMHKGEIVQWNNHEPIIDEKLFFRAFNYVSEVNLDGTSNEHYRPPAESRSREKIEREAPYPVLKGLLYVHFNGVWRRCGVEWSGKIGAYHYRYRGWQDGDVSWVRRSDLLDDVVRHFIKRRLLSAVEQGEVRDDYDPERERQRALHQVNAEIASVEQDKQDIFVRLNHSTLPEFIKHLEEQFVAAEAELARLQVKKHELLSQTYLPLTHPEIAAEYREAVENHWLSATAEERHRFVRLFIRKVEVPEWRGRWTKLVIYWTDGEKTEAEVHGANGRGKGVGWNFESLLKLRELLESGASREDFLEAFGKRWDTVRSAIRYFYGYDFPLPQPRGTERVNESETRDRSRQSARPRHPARHTARPCRREFRTR